MIYEDLPTGAFNGVTSDELMKKYNIANTRELGRQIHDERMHGKPILNRGNKYFRSDDPRDFAIWFRTIFKRGSETMNVARNVMQMCPVDDGQITVEDLMKSLADEVDDDKV